jgi:cysteine desulfurase
MFAPVYLDHNATTPLDPRVLEAMLPFLREQFGNASSRHDYGRVARDAVDRARQQVAAAVGAHETEVVFTSGGTEANNLFIKGVAALRPAGLVAVGATEHPCVLKPARQLARQGWILDTLPVDANGVAGGDFSTLAARRPQIVSLMLANNETGAIQPVASLAEALKGSGAAVHSDAVQALGKRPVDFRALNRCGLHAMTLSAHKVGGPKGAGALVVDKRIDLEPLLAGGGHERGLRSGTENVAAIVGFGAACGLIGERLRSMPALHELRDLLEARVFAMGARVFGAGADRVGNTSYFAFPGIDGETLVGRLDRAGFAVASGAACSSAQPEPSHVLSAMGVAPDIARGAVRVSLGPDNTEVEIENFLSALQATLQALRGTASIALAA